MKVSFTRSRTSTARKLAVLQMIVHLTPTSLEELSEIRLLMDASICFMVLGGWLDFVLMYCGWSFGFL